ncbi:MAG TPA: IclR family transcriptional regulator [Streptosporangiaceae bacterium]|nr:IclR family transcriptional regulator [Streptosporangiaceae bacterium]
MTESAAGARPARTGGTQVLTSVANSARLLREFGRGEPQLGVSELARRLGIAKSSAHRIVHTLAKEGLLERVEETGAYRLSVTMQILGASAQATSGLHAAATAALDQLRALTRETVHLSVLDGLEVVYVERRESPGAVRMFGRIGHRGPAHSTGSGKVLLAFLPAEELDRRLAGVRLARRTPYTITSQDQLRAELNRIRARGWAENVNEAQMGFASVAAPIRNPAGEVVAALSVVGPVQRLDGDNLRRFARPVTESAALISRRLGWGEFVRTGEVPS